MFNLCILLSFQIVFFIFNSSGRRHIKNHHGYPAAAPHPLTAFSMLFKAVKLSLGATEQDAQSSFL